MFKLFILLFSYYFHFIKIPLLVGVLDQFLGFKVFVIFLTPVQDKWMEFLVII